MAHIEDRWYRILRHPDGTTRRVRTERFGKGLRYRVRYPGPDGRERKKSFPDRTLYEAKAFLVSVEADKLRGSYIDPVAGRMTFGEYAKRWLQTRTFDESTRESTEHRVRKHLLPYFGLRHLGSITPGHIREWDHGLAAILAPATRSVIFAHLRAILGAAVDDGRIAKNPCSARSVQQPRPPKNRVVPWTAAQVITVRAQLADRYRAMVDLAAGCGPRQGEALGLGVEDLDLDDGWLHIRRQVKLVRSRLVFGLPKNDLPRDIPMPDTVARALRHHAKHHPPVEVTLPWEDPASSKRVTAALVFTTPRRNAINRRTFDAKSWHPALRAAGIVPTRETGMHALRHFYASAALDAGVSIKALAEYLGHADPGFTLRVYTHLMPAGENRIRAAIDEVLGDGKAS